MHGGLVDWAVEIRRLRRSKLLKQAALASVLGIDQATVSRWENGKAIPELGMQRRLRDLLRRSVPDESLLRHAVAVSLGSIVLSDEQRIMQAVSAGYSRAHGLPQHAMPGRCNRGKFGDVEVLVEEVARRGFYRGDIASATLICRAPSISGHRPPVPIKIVWTPTCVQDRVLLRGDRIDLEEKNFDSEIALNGAAIRFVMMDELVG